MAMPLIEGVSFLTTGLKQLLRITEEDFRGQANLESWAMLNGYLFIYLFIFFFLGGGGGGAGEGRRS